MQYLEFYTLSKAPTDLKSQYQTQLKIFEVVFQSVSRHNTEHQGSLSVFQECYQVRHHTSANTFVSPLLERFQPPSVSAKQS